MAILDSRSEDGQGRQVDVEEQLFHETVGGWCVCVFVIRDRQCDITIVDVDSLV